MPSRRLPRPTRAPKPSNQQLFHDIFAGVAMQASRSGDTQPIRVATTGVFEFDCVSTTLEVGDMMGPDENVGRHRALERHGGQSHQRQRRRRPLRQALEPGRHARAGRHRQHDAQGRHAGSSVSSAGVRCRVSDRSATDHLSLRLDSNLQHQQENIRDFEIS